MCLAVPGLVVSVHGAALERAGRVDFGGVVKEVSLALLPDTGPGDYVLVHAGFALTALDGERARQVLADLGIPEPGPPEEPA